MTTSMAIILAITGGAYVALRSHSQGGIDPLAAAAAGVTSSHAALVLEQKREHMIRFDAASKTMSIVSSPKLAAKPVPTPSIATGTTGTTGTTGVAADAAPPAPPPDPGTAQSVAYQLLPSFGFSTSQFSCVDDIFSRESGWRYNAENASGAYGIPQALPGSKMASAGPDWQTNVTTQIKWGLGYMKDRYGSPCGAWSFWQAHGWY